MVSAGEHPRESVLIRRDLREHRNLWLLPCNCLYWLGHHLVVERRPSVHRALGVCVLLANTLADWVNRVLGPFPLLSAFQADTKPGT